jgi:ribosomal protein S12 methylthiotransferase accessory factor
MDVGIAGDGPARAAIEAALSDLDATTRAVEPAAIDEGDLGVVVAPAGNAAFEVANRTALSAGVPWLAVELGGIGGYPVVDAAVAGLGPSTPCYDCLSSRVGANVDPAAEPRAAPDDPTARFAGALAGRRVAAHSAGEDVPGTVVEVPYARRELLPVPHCDCGEESPGPLSGGNLRRHDSRSLEAALTSAERGLDERLGIVSEVGEAESYPAPYYLAQVCDTSDFSDATAMRKAAGVDGDWNGALMRALGEALERYCAGVYRNDRLDRGPAEAIENAVPPDRFVGPETPADGDRLWVPGVALDTDRKVSLPAELVLYPPPTEQYRPAITTGLGLGNSAVEAVLSGLYETVERDATMLSWYSTFEPLELTVDDEGYRTLASRAGAEDLSTTALLLTQDVDVPVVAVAVHREEWPRLALGSAAHLDPERAARRALAEALQNWTELRGMGPDDAVEASGAVGRYADDPDAVWDGLEPTQQVAADAVGPETVPDGSVELETVIERATSADMDAYAARTTTRDVDMLGFEAVRVLLPEAQPLFLGEPFFGERAERVPPELGFEPRLDREQHPFP